MVYLFGALAISFFILFLRIGREIYYTYRCPEERTLRDFVYGRLKKYEQKNRMVISHLGQCKKCQERLFKIQHGNPLEDHLIEEEG